jgi:hypothetical protein
MSHERTSRFMKTMLKLVTRLVEMGRYSERAQTNPHLSDGEKAAARLFEGLLRGCVPETVLATYDRMKETEPELLGCPEVFAMAVLAATRRSVISARRNELLSHIARLSAAQRARQRSGALKNRRRHLLKWDYRAVATLNN